jgi:hypothetical protein
VKFTYQAFVYTSKYQSIDDIAKGGSQPMLSDDKDGYFAKQGYPLIGTAEVTVTLHSSDEIVQNQITALQAQLQDARAQAHLAEQAILERISKLQALTYEPATA